MSASRSRCRGCGYTELNQRLRVLPKKQARSMRKSSQRQEREGALEMHGRVQPGSGNMIGAKGDVVTSEWMFEYKESHGKTKIVHLDELLTVAKEAGEAGLLPAMGLRFHGTSGLFDYIILRKEDFKRLAGI